MQKNCTHHLLSTHLLATIFNICATSFGSMNKNYKIFFVFLSNHYDNRQIIYLSMFKKVRPKKQRGFPFSLYFFCGFLFTSYSLLSKEIDCKNTVQICRLSLICLQG
jgi:hypothetical protein